MKARVQPIGIQTHSQDIYAVMSEEAKIDTDSTDRKGQVLISTMEKPLTRVRQEEHDKLDQTAENKITNERKVHQ